VAKCLEALPAQLREVIERHYFQEQSGAEIAAVLQLTLANVKVRLFRARQHLNTCLEDNADHGDS
jgi:RNA polymerase sigma-70 factor (ECF subfamily)